jgi:plasmid maintenance system antidote protein VapI
MSKEILADIDIGSILEKKFRASQVSIEEFAIKLKCSRTTVYTTVFARKSIGIERLIWASEILDTDFIRTIFWREPANCKGLCLINEMINSIEHIHKSVSDMFNHDVNIGCIIKKYLIDKKIKFIDFAGMLDCDISVVSAIFKHKSIDIKTLINISIILDFDFINSSYYKHGTIDTDANILTIKKSIEWAEADIKRAADIPLPKISDYKI